MPRATQGPEAAADEKPLIKSCERRNTTQVCAVRDRLPCSSDPPRCLFSRLTCTAEAWAGTPPVWFRSAFHKPSLAFPCLHVDPSPARVIPRPTFFPVTSRTHLHVRLGVQRPVASRGQHPRFPAVEAIPKVFIPLPVST